MSTVLTQRKGSSIGRKKRPIIAAEANELIAFCPKCCTLETVWFTEEGLIVPTQKFSQYGTRLHHNCGADASCHIYRIS